MEHHHNKKQINRTTNANKGQHTHKQNENDISKSVTRTQWVYWGLQWEHKHLLQCYHIIHRESLACQKTPLRNFNRYNGMRNKILSLYNKLVPLSRAFLFCGFLVLWCSTSNWSINVNNGAATNKQLYYKNYGSFCYADFRNKRIPNLDLTKKKLDWKTKLAFKIIIAYS